MAAFDFGYQHYEDEEEEEFEGQVGTIKILKVRTQEKLL